MKKTIYKKDIYLSKDAILRLKAAETDFAKEKYKTYGTVIYSDGKKLELLPVVSSNGECYTWHDGKIYRHKKNNNFDHRVFNIKDRKMEEILLRGNKIVEIINNETHDNTSAKIEEITELENGNRLISNSYWDYNDSLNEEYYLLNSDEEIHYISSRTLCSPDENDVMEGIICYKNYIVFYYFLDEQRTLPHITRIYDISNNSPKVYFSGSRFFETIDEDTRVNIKRLIREQEKN